MAFGYPLKTSLKNLASRLAKVEVLICDPDDYIAVTLRDVLRHIGFERITFARDGNAALDILKKKEIDLLITDWNMNPMDGIRLVHYLRSSPDSPNPYMPIIMLTGKAERRDVEVARDVGVTEFVVKPFSAKTLYERLVLVIENPRSFIIASNFRGPQRRRRTDIPPGGEDRRITPPVG
jgi:two-component system chemotaxis response regulator CheY